MTTRGSAVADACPGAPAGSVDAFPAPVATLLRQADLCLVDVGARGTPPEAARRLAPFLRLIAFEPDAAEATRLRTGLREYPWRAFIVRPEAIGRPPKATLHVTVRPGFSSLLPPDQAVADRYRKINESVRVTHTREVPTVGLDEAAAAHGFRDACWLKLDTQGTELHILETGQSLLDSVVGVQTEVAFQPLYRSQPMFADVDAHLRSHGFALADLRVRSMRGRGFDRKLYSRRQPVGGDCLYLREPDADRPRALARYLALALAYDQHDLLRSALTRGRTPATLGDGDAGRLLETAIDYMRRRTAAKLDGLPRTESRRLLAATEKRP